MAGALVDFGLFVFHNARTLHGRQRGPYFYLPKLEAMEEAALWDEVMASAEDELELPAGCMKATVLIETLPAAFQMHEILHALRRRVGRPQLRPLGLHLLLPEDAARPPRPPAARTRPGR